MSTSLTNHGTVVWTGGRVLYQGGTSVIVNASDGTWEAQGDLEVASAVGPQGFTNAGLLHKTTGAGALTLGGVTMTNTSTGKLDIDAGTVQLQSGGTLSNSGLIDVAASASFNLGNVTFENGTSFAGSGTLTMPGTTTVNATNLNLTLPANLTSLLTGPGKVTINAPFTWTSGTMSLTNGLEVASGRTLTLPTSDHGLVNTSLVNHGTVEWTGGRVLYQGGTNVIVNEADGIWSVAAGSFEVATAGGTQTFTNLGLLQGTGIATTTLTVASSVTFTQGTTVDIQIIH
jgi:hypothetical protein